MEGEIDTTISDFHPSISAILGIYNVDERDDGQIQQERKLEYSTQSIALFVVGGIVLISLISMNLYMNGWRKGCGKRRSQAISELKHEESTMEPNNTSTTDNIQFETYCDDDIEMSIEAKSKSSQMENITGTNESNLTRLGRTLASYHPKVFDAIRQMSVANPITTTVDNK
jgi:hypothetical protein